MIARIVPDGPPLHGTRLLAAAQRILLRAFANWPSRPYSHLHEEVPISDPRHPAPQSLEARFPTPKRPLSGRSHHCAKSICRCLNHLRISTPLAAAGSALSSCWRLLLMPRGIPNCLPRAYKRRDKTNPISPGPARISRFHASAEEKRRAACPTLPYKTNPISPNPSRINQTASPRGLPQRPAAGNREQPTPSASSPLCRRR
jgi:hypothetical protein